MIKSGDKVVIEAGPASAKGKTGTVVRVESRTKASDSNGAFVVYIPGKYESVMASRVRKVGKNPARKYNRKRRRSGAKKSELYAKAMRRAQRILKRSGTKGLLKEIRRLLVKSGAKIR